MKKRKSKKILLIDDEVGFTRLLKMNLEEAGNYTVLIENNGLQGLAAVKQFRPDLILLDIIMPDIHGTEIAWQVRSDPSTRKIPIVFLTALVSNKELESPEIIIGKHPYVAKPASVETVVKSIECNLMNV